MIATDTLEVGAVLPHAPDGQQSGESRAVVGDTGSAEAAVGLDRDIFLIPRRVPVRGRWERGRGRVAGGSH